ncbi:MAG: hypothetical protein ACOYN0_02870 [Phycisphaerales bacterium]
MKGNCWGLCAVGAAASSVFGQHGGDVGLSVTDAAIRTNDRVYLADFGELAANFTDEPGFDCIPGTFAPGSALGFTAHGALQKWNGSGFAIAEERLEIGFGGVLSALTPLDNSDVFGFSLPVGANGQWHRHLEYTLQAPATDGAYLLALSLASSDTGLAPSEVFYIVFNQNLNELQHDKAAQWVRDNLLLQPCRADWDGSGGVDGDDVIAFFADWDVSDADYDGSGGTDGDDVIAFFSAWDRGC